MIKNPKLYAVVPHVVPKTRPESRPKTRVAVREERSAEHRLKSNIDRADQLLTRLEQRQADFAREIARLQKRKACAVARYERVKDRIIAQMEQAGLSKADGWKKTLICRPGPPAVTVDNEELVPREFLRESISYAPDKIRIKEALEHGFVIDDAEALPDEFLSGRYANFAAIRAALDGDARIPGVRPLTKISGCRLTQKTSLTRK